MIKCENSINFHFSNDKVTYSLEELIEHFQNIFETNFASIQSGQMVMMDEKVVQLLAYFDKARSLDIPVDGTFAIQAAVTLTPQGLLDKVVLTIGAPMEAWVYSQIVGKSGNIIIHSQSDTLIAVDIRQRSKDITTYLTVDVAKNMINEVQLSPAVFFPHCDNNIVLTDTAHKSLKELAISVARLTATLPKTIINDPGRVSAIEIWKDFVGKTIKLIDDLISTAYVKGLWTIESYSEEGGGIKRAFRNLSKFQENRNAMNDFNAREYNEIANVQVLMGILGVELLNLLDQDFYRDPHRRPLSSLPIDSLKELEQAVDSKPKPIYS